MLDPALCDRPLSRWIHFRNGILFLLGNPVLLVLVLVSLTLILWWLPKSPWNQRLSLIPFTCLLLYLAAFSPPVLQVANWGLLQFLPQDSGATADAIVILGRGQDFQPSRMAVAAQLWRSQRAPRIFASGRQDGPEMVQRLAALGIPQEMLAQENCSQTTAENAQFTALLLQPQGVKRIILVTDPPHMLRSLLTFRSVGFSVIPQTSEMPTVAPTRRALLIFREYAGMVSYILQGRFFPQPLQPQQIGSRAALWQKSL